LSEELPDVGGARVAVPDFLRPVRSLVVAVLDPQGRLLDANQGFFDLLPEADDSALWQSPGAVFVNPTLPELLASTAEEGTAAVFDGLMTLGDLDGNSETWVGRVYRKDGQLLVACELDVNQDRELRSELLALNQEYAQKERELARANRELARYAEELERLSLFDSLTGLANRRYFEDMLSHHMDTSQRFGEPLSVVILDLDFFKGINDTYGHAVGDEVLKAVAAALQANARQADIVARWGGEEFGVLALRTDAAGGLALAERLRSGVAQGPWPESVPRGTVSAGVAEWQTSETAEALFRRADAGLYRAKEKGRDRTELADPAGG
jgi:diguanylate cyclase (GGDEF)-like protein